MVAEIVAVGEKVVDVVLLVEPPLLPSSIPLAARFLVAAYPASLPQTVQCAWRDA